MSRSFGRNRNSDSAPLHQIVRPLTEWKIRFIQSTVLHFRNSLGIFIQSHSPFILLRSFIVLEVDLCFSLGILPLASIPYAVPL